MEIEAKLAIPNRRTYRTLMHLQSLAGYDWDRTETVRDVDRYFDTPDGRLLSAGYACRCRSRGAATIATLKSIGGARGAVHQRDELEVALPAWSPDPIAWPESPARTRALELTAGAELRLLCELRQSRAMFDVVAGDRAVGELSLDAVRVMIGQRPNSYYELELELVETGKTEDLDALVSELTERWRLTPEPRSKFERALVILHDRAEAEARLTPEERAQIEVYAHADAAELARRAIVVLAWADSVPTREIVARSGLSAGRVRYWVRAFRAKRLSIFDAALATAAQTPARASQPSKAPPAAESAAVDAEQPRRRGLPTVSRFCRQQGVEMKHAQYVAAQAVTLFDALRAVHRVPRRRRRLLRQAALLHTVGMAQDPERHYEVGRDLILAQPLHNVSTTDRLALACIIAFNRNKVRPDREPAMAALEGKLRPQVLTLSALLHVAEAIDSSRTQSTSIVEIRGVDTPRCEVQLVGPKAEQDATQATVRAELWYRLFDQELALLPPEVEHPPEGAGEASETATGSAGRPLDVEAPKSTVIPVIAPEAPMSEAGRQILQMHFEKMLANEAGTRLGKDIEALHDMRVATRRMRAALQIFEPYYEAKALAPLIKGLRRTGRTLGAVRDLDVLLQKAEAFKATLPAEQIASFDPLLAHWQGRREVARWQMLEYLDHAAYPEFVDNFGEFLATPGAGAILPPPGEPTPYQVRHIVPRLIIARYEAVRAYEPVISGAPLTTYHMLRIDCKRLRYATEFFRDILGQDAPDLIKQVTAMQDLLGELQDTHVAEGLVVEFLGQGRKRKKQRQLPVLEGVESYLAALRALQSELLGRFPAQWASLIGYPFRRALALAIATL